MRARLNPAEESVLVATQLDGTLSAPQIAKLVGMKIPSVRYALNNLFDKGFLSRSALVDTRKLGLTDVTVYFSTGLDAKSTNRFLQALHAESKVTWVATFGGDYQFGCALSVHSLFEADAILEQFSKKFTGIFFERTLAVQKSLSIFPKKYLSHKKIGCKVISRGKGTYSDEIKELSVIERKLLSLLCAEGFSSYRELGRKLAVAHTTVEHHMQKLTREKVLVGLWHPVNEELLGVNCFKLLVYCKGRTSEMSKALFSFCESHPRIVHFVECLGAWDFEIGVDATEVNQVVQAVQQLYEHYGQHISTIKVLPMASVVKVVPFPLGV